MAAATMHVSATEATTHSSTHYLTFNPNSVERFAQDITSSPKPISPEDTNRLRRRKPLREEWKYSSGRFIFNESKRLAERGTRFDVQALEKEVSRCMNHAQVLSTRLYQEGNKSRLLQMSFDDRRKVIVKIPYKPQPSHYATASEVATMSFLRSRGIPVPKVYGWSSDASKNQAGVEFIVMEKARGIAATARLDGMEKSDIEKMVSGFVDVEKYLFALPFGAFGSLYFNDDVPEAHRRPLFSEAPTDSHKYDRRFCIGPTADPFFWPNKTTQLTKDHGPWATTSEFLQSLGNCALDWMNKHGASTCNKFPFNSLFEDSTRTVDQARLIRKYLSFAQVLLAGTPDKLLHSSALRHPGLSSRNIYISRSVTAISCITNWRHATILPFAVAAGFPRAFDSPSTPQGSCCSPRLPPTFTTAMDSAVQYDAKRIYIDQLLHYTYRIKTTLRNTSHAQVLDVLPVQLLQRLQHALRHPYTGVKNLVLLKGALVAISQNWRSLSTGIACPASLSFTAAEIEGQALDEELLDDAEELIVYVKKEIGIHYDRNDVRNDSDGNQGWVSHDRYESAKQRNRELKDEWMAQAENVTEERQIDLEWMFQDDADDADSVVA